MDLLQDVLGQIRTYVHDGTTAGIIKYVGEIVPDVVFHMATMFRSSHQISEIEEMIKSNVLFGTQVAESLTHVPNSKLINCGTAWQHFDGKSYSPVALYAATKQAMQDVLLYYSEVKGVKILTLKFFDVYGPGDPRPKVLNIIREASKMGYTIDMSGGEQLINLVYVTDAVDAILLAYKLMNKTPRQKMEFFVRAEHAVTLKNLVDLYHKITNRDIKVRWGARKYREREMFHPWIVGDNLPGWVPKVSLLKGIQLLETSQS
jgi:nucleoside-diphosphate-sugar epimerase